MGIFRLAGLPGLGNISSPSNGRGPDLCPPLRPCSPWSELPGRTISMRPTLPFNRWFQRQKSDPPIKGNGSVENEPPLRTKPSREARKGPNGRPPPTLSDEASATLRDQL